MAPSPVLNKNTAIKVTAIYLCSLEAPQGLSGPASSLSQEGRKGLGLTP